MMSAIRARKISAKEMSSIQVLLSLIHSRQVSSFFSGTTEKGVWVALFWSWTTSSSNKVHDYLTYHIKVHLADLLLHHWKHIFWFDEIFNWFFNLEIFAIIADLQTYD
jgi:hypothetical protein